MALCPARHRRLNHQGAPDGPHQPSPNEDLDTHRIDVLNEIERRQRLADTPAQVAALAERYVADGGEASDLVAALSI